MKLMFWKRRRRSLLRDLAYQTSYDVLLPSTRAAIEKMAEDFARDMLADPVFREQLRQEATAAARDIARSLKESRESREAD
ncbi:MAG TPA: hypothetical protein VKQ32_20615 [Polyangia bacterium]|nr:hypothetical protein [Polyangia bacterium]